MPWFMYLRYLQTKIHTIQNSKNMEIVNILGSLSSIIALVITILLYVKVEKISQNSTVKGDNNIVSGRDSRVKTK